MGLESCLWVHASPGISGFYAADPHYKTRVFLKTRYTIGELLLASSAEYPSGYSMTVSDVVSNGFGFAFPQGSPLASKMSYQIAKLREDGTLKALENKWFNQQPKDSDSALKIPKLEGFLGLFLISGGSMAVAFFIYVLYFINEKLHFREKLAFIMRFLVHRPAASAV